jgi:hypothetical protein
MKKTTGTFKQENSSTKLIESLRQSYKNKDLIHKANNYENSNRGLSETKLTFTKVKNVNQKQMKKSEEPSSRITEENFRNKSKEKLENGNSNSNNSHQIKINVLYNKNNNHSNSNLKKDANKMGDNSNRSSNNLLENSKLNISLAGLITNTNNNLNHSPKDGLKVTASNYSKFAHNAKHVKSKSISSNRGILSSLNMLKNKKMIHKSKNESSYNNISFENTKENIVNNTNKSSHLVLVESNILGDHSHGHVRNNSNASSNYQNQSSNAKSTNKGGSTASSITKPGQGGSSIVEIDSPEELHFFYVSLSIQNKSLAYKFENLNLSDEEEFKGTIDL